MGSKKKMRYETATLKRPPGLTTRMLIITSIVFALTWSLFYAIAVATGRDTLFIPIVMTIFFTGLQYFASPWVIQWTMGVQWVTPQEQPELHGMIAELARKAGISTPRVGISYLEIPNAFAFGRWRSDGRVCVTMPLLDMLKPEELKAVLGHEIMHIRNRDVAVITFLSLLPNIFFYIFRISLRSRDRRSMGPLVGLASLLLYFLLQLFVLYVSRIREYAADEGAVRLGNPPAALASALFKLVRGATLVPREALQGAAGYKAFFATDPSRADEELLDIAQIDADGSGSIDTQELNRVRQRGIRRSRVDAILELLSTHPNMAKRLERLAHLETPRRFESAMG